MGASLLQARNPARTCCGSQPPQEEGRMTSEDQTLLYKAAADPNGQIALKRSRCGEWHADRDRLDVLARCGHLLSLGERMGPHLGGTFALWQITPVGRALADDAGSAIWGRADHR